uniref:C-C motif chemokine n=1 Tax=Oryzias melastigma TaxID=30732 RepID=A0A3B3BBN6_ORYME
MYGLSFQLVLNSMMLQKAAELHRRAFTFALTTGAFPLHLFRDEWKLCHQQNQPLSNHNRPPFFLTLLTPSEDQNKYNPNSSSPQEPQLKTKIHCEEHLLLLHRLQRNPVDMRTAAILLLCMLGAALFCTISCDSSSGPDSCCFKFFPRRLGVSKILSFSLTDDRCPKPGVVLVTKRNINVCVDRNETWVQDLLQKLV